MTWFFAVLIVLLMGAVAVVASGRGGSLGPAYDDRADVRLPADLLATVELQPALLDAAEVGERLPRDAHLRRRDEVVRFPLHARGAVGQPVAEALLRQQRPALALAQGPRANHQLGRAR